MKKRLLALVLSVSLLLSIPVAAAEGLENFRRGQTYTGQFSDLAADSVFYQNIAALYEYGLSVGKGDGTFGVSDSLTVGQVVIFAGRIRSLYRTGDAELGAASFRAEGQSMAEPYLLYLQSEAILEEELTDRLPAAATRAEMAHALANLLPESALPPVNDAVVAQGYAQRRYLTDVTEYTPYYRDILTLYRTGVSNGSDAAGSFRPDADITRGAAAAMLTRLVDPSLRLMLDWDVTRDVPSARGTTYGDLAAVPNPLTGALRDPVLRRGLMNMLEREEDTIKLNYPGVTAAAANRMLTQMLDTVKTYCEQGYNAASCRYSNDGDLTFRFYSNEQQDAEATRTGRDYALEAAIEVHDALWEDGTLNGGMTEYQLAEAYYQWVCDHCTYDYAADANSASHTAYALFHDQKAVCDGYTGAYNMLLKLEGIACGALANQDHIWTVAELDGVEYHIDTTWGDTGNQIDYRYFGMTEGRSRAVHSW